MRYRPYPDYRDSGVEWLGGVPKHWVVPPLRARYRVDLGKMLDTKRISGSHPVPYLRNIDVQWDQVSIRELPEMDVKPTEYDRYTLKGGDLVVCEGGEVGRSAIWRDELALCAFQKALHRLRPRSPVDDVPRFLYYVMSAAASRGAFTAGSNPNTIPHLTGEMLRAHRLPFPAASEQRDIAGFLDSKTARIDALIAKKERLTELLQENRAGLISRAASKGLDPNAPMKDSGVEWLGEIPAHWEVVKLGVRAEVGNGSTPSRENSEYWRDGSIPWLTSAKINERFVESADEFVTPAAFRQCHLPMVKAGSVLVAITGEGQTRGRAALLRMNSTISQHLAYVTPKAEALKSEFLLRQLEAQYAWLRSESTGGGSTKGALTCEQVRSIPVLVPPVAEQDAITRLLADAEARAVALRDKIEEAVERLREYRAALISAAVTGKIDVRGEVFAEQTVGRS